VTNDRLVKHLRLAAPFLVLGVAVAVGYVFGPSWSLLVLAGSVMVTAIGLLWTSIRALFGETPLGHEEAYALGAPSAEEEQKRAVLRAIKDLEFERSVGKISKEDYDVLIARYRADAKRLLRLLDERAKPERERAEKAVARYLAEAGLGDGTTPPPEKNASKKDEAAAVAVAAAAGDDDDGDGAENADEDEEDESEEAQA
jgi:hypothetical protein